jgi:hypothetical protein
MAGRTKQSGQYHGNYPPQRAGTGRAPGGGSLGDNAEELPKGQVPIQAPTIEAQPWVGGRQLAARG